MYEIIKITKKRNPNYNLYIDGYKDDKIEVHLETLYQYELYKYGSIDEDTFCEMMSENEKKLAKQRALAILSRGSKTRKEILSKLIERRYSQDAIDYAMSFVDKYNFIDEEYIAQTLVEGRYTAKKYSKRAMATKLWQKGIDSSIINKALNDIDYETEYQNAIYFAERKLRSIRDDDIRKIKQKLVSALSYRGFSYDIINKVTSEVLKKYRKD